MKDRKILPITRKYQDVNMNGVKLFGKIMIEAESGGIKMKMPMLITEREDKKPLLGIDWLRDFNWTIRNIGSTTTITDQSEEDKIFTKSEELFKTN